MAENCDIDKHVILTLLPVEVLPGVQKGYHSLQSYKVFETSFKIKQSQQFDIRSTIRQLVDTKF